MILKCQALDGISQKVLWCCLTREHHLRVIFYGNADIHCFCAGGFSEFRLMERLGEGQKPTAIIGEVADEWNLDLVVLSMEAIHSKHVDGNLLAEFIPCPVLLLPL